MDLLARDEDAARRLGRIAAETRGASFVASRAAYAKAFGEAMARPASVGGNVNALQHLVGHVKDRSAARELARLVEEYRESRAPLGVAKREVRRRLVEARAEWAVAQSYLDEHGGPGDAEARG